MHLSYMSILYYLRSLQKSPQGGKNKTSLNTNFMFLGILKSPIPISFVVQCVEKMFSLR